jgi:hypothetical protein
LLSNSELILILQSPFSHVRPYIFLKIFLSHVHFFLFICQGPCLCSRYFVIWTTTILTVSVQLRLRHSPALNTEFEPKFSVKLILKLRSHILLALKIGHFLERLFFIKLVWVYGFFVPDFKLHAQPIVSYSNNSAVIYKL